MNNVVLWNVTPCGSGKDRRIGGTYRLQHQGENNQPAMLILFTLMMRLHVPPKRLFLQEPHGAKSQNTAFL
jgi:hypothetical protein